MADESIFYEGTEVVHYDAEGERPAEDYGARTMYCIKPLDKDFYARGAAICGRDDLFNEEKGKKYSKQRMNDASKKFQKYKPTIENYKELNKHRTSLILASSDLGELEIKLLTAASSTSAPEKCSKC